MYWFYYAYCFIVGGIVIIFKVGLVFLDFIKEGFGFERLSIFLGLFGFGLLG